MGGMKESVGAIIYNVQSHKLLQCKQYNHSSDNVSNYSDLLNDLTCW